MLRSLACCARPCPSLHSSLLTAQVSNNPQLAEHYLALADEAEDSLMSQSQTTNVRDRLVLLGPGEIIDAQAVRESVSAPFAGGGGVTLAVCPPPFPPAFSHTRTPTRTHTHTQAHTCMYPHIHTHVRTPSITSARLVHRHKHYAWHHARRSLRDAFTRPPSVTSHCTLLAHAYAARRSHCEVPSGPGGHRDVH
jgi:hypothetical protein